MTPFGLVKSLRVFFNVRMTQKDPRSLRIQTACKELHKALREFESIQPKSESSEIVETLRLLDKIKKQLRALS